MDAASGGGAARRKIADTRLDREHIAEEIEDLGKSERNAVRSQIRRILEHVLKLAYSPAAPPRFGWIETVREARQDLSDGLTASPRHDAHANLTSLYADACERAEAALRQNGEPGAAARLPSFCPFSLDQICGPGWYPPRDGGQR